MNVVVVIVSAVVVWDRIKAHRAGRWLCVQQHGGADVFQLWSTTNVVSELVSVIYTTTNVLT